MPSDSNAPLLNFYVPIFLKPQTWAELITFQEERKVMKVSHTGT
jgi:hypothetical protein